MKVLLYLALSVTVIFSLHHDKHHDSHEEHKDEHHDHHITKAQEQLKQANLQFALNLYRHVYKSTPKNIFFSPLSVSIALAMLSLGARSDTQQQILHGLSFNQTKIKEDIHELYEHLLQTLNEPKNNLQITIGNALFVEEKLRVLKSFFDKLEHQYRAELIGTNFRNTKKAVEQINNYVKNKTNGKIKELVKDLEEGIKLVMINHVFFKGKWEMPFHPDSTQLGRFSLDPNTSVEVPIMSHTDSYKILQDKDLPCTVLHLPYKSNAFMLIVVSELGKIHEVEKELSKEVLARWINSAAKTFVELRLPKFSISSSLNLKEILSDMGMTNMFTDDADFSGITKDVKLKVSKVFHKAVLDVDEKGTEAAGATAIEGVPMALFPTHKVDRPFITLLCTKDIHTMLFLGRIIDPTEK
ncbi:serine protease inhibitor A6-like [Rhinophrynus dorsalis]